MRFLASVKTRFPRLYPVLTLMVALGTVGGVASYERRASAADCCATGAACCKPGAACCKGHRHGQE